MIIKNGMVFGEDQTFTRRDLYIEKGKIVESVDCLTDLGEVDAQNLYVLPGLIDIHSHGAAGHDFSDGDPKGLEAILAYQYAHGITGYVPTTMSLPQEKLLEVLGSVEKSKEREWSELAGRRPGLARLLGIHLEGPFLDPSKRGVHREEALCPPDVDFLKACDRACGGRIRLLTLSPNLEGAPELIRALKGADRTGTDRKDICERLHISLGHTAADYETCRRAFEAGADHVTHLFNAMNPFHHREPGLIGAAAEADCTVELIADGIHVHESAVRAAFRLFPDRVVLVSDSMRGTGLKDGMYDLGGRQVQVQGSRAALQDGTIAGSVTNLFDCMKKAVSFGIPLEEAVAAATIHPARAIGLADRVGSLAPGKDADVLLVNQKLELVSVNPV